MSDFSPTSNSKNDSSYSFVKCTKVSIATKSLTIRCDVPLLTLRVSNPHTTKLIGSSAPLIWLEVKPFK